MPFKDSMAPRTKMMTLLRIFFSVRDLLGIQIHLLLLSPTVLGSTLFNVPTLNLRPYLLLDIGKFLTSIILEGRSR